MLLTGLAGVLVLAQPAQAQVLGPFDQALDQYTRDKVLDRQEYAWLRQLGGQRLPGSDRSLAKHFLGFMDKHTHFIHISYSYARDRRPVRLSFAFAPTYSENSFIEGGTSRDLLAQISQNDVLNETGSDAVRCGAAAILSAHYLLFGSFDGAFARLNVQAQGLTYRAVHLAQEALYRLANRDGKAGLVTKFQYTQYRDGRVEHPVPEGEIKQAAQLVQLRVHPLIGPNKSRFHDRKQAVATFWRSYPEAPFLVGVHMNVKTGNLRAPSAAHPQNHFVLIFRQNNIFWLLNSGVLNNGNRSALISLTEKELQLLLYQTQGTVEALTRLS